MSESERLSKPFVDRQAELRQLHDTLNLVIRTQKPKFILISGDFGVGKTALIEHFLSEVSEQIPSLMIGQAKCAMETEGNGLIPFSQLLSSLMDLRNGQPVEQGSTPEIILKETAPAWLDILSIASADKDSTASDTPLGHDDAGADQAPHKTTFVNRSGGVDIRAENVNIYGDVIGRDKITSTYTQDQVFVQYTNALKRLAEKQSVLAFVDDLQWTDASSLRLLFHLSRNLEDSAMMFISAYRTVQALETGLNAKMFGEIHAELINSGAREIEIRTGLTVKRYVDQRYLQNQFPEELIERVQTQTEGHALYVSQLFSLWEETKVIEPIATSEGQTIWKLTHDTDIKIPEEVGLVLDERIKQMEEELRGILTNASIEGENFTAQVVARLRQLDETRIFDDLDIIEYRYRLIHENGSQEVAMIVLDMYRFAHRFFGERIYQKMSSGKRRNLHRQVGECLEALCSDRRPIAGQLARHFGEAHNARKAANYALMAAQFELSRYALAVSVQWCERGLQWFDALSPSDQVQSLPLRVNLLEGLGNVYYEMGNYGQADQSFRSALKYAQQIPLTAEQLARLCEKISDVCEYEGLYSDVKQFVQLARKFLSDGKVPSPNEIQMDLDQDEIFMQMRTGQNKQSIQSFKQLLAEAQGLPSTHTLEELKASIYNGLAIAHSKIGQFREALDAYQNAADIAELMGNKAFKATCWLNMADSYLKHGDLDQSQTYVETAGNFARQIGDLEDVAYAQASRGEILLARGQPQEAIREIEEAIAEFERLGSTWNMPYMYADLAMAYMAMSDIAAAYLHAQRALSYTKDTDSQFEMGISLLALARIEVVRNEWNEAEQHFQQAIAIHRKFGYRHFEGRARRDYAEALLQRGEKIKADKLLRQALRIFRKLDLVNETAKTEELLGEASARDTLDATEQ